MHCKDADLVDRSEAILVGAEDAVLAAGFAFEIEHRVDQVFEQSRTGNRAVLGHVTDDEGRAPGAFGVFHQRLRAVADLGDAAGVGFGFGQPHGLDRVDQKRRRPAPFELVEHGAQVRFRIDENRCVDLQTLRAQFHLGGGFFAADVDDFAGAGETLRDLQQQRGFARAGRSADEREAAGHDSPAERRVELGHAGRAGVRVLASSTSPKHHGLGGRHSGARRSRARFDGKGPFVKGVPGVASGQRPSQRGDSNPHAEQE